MKISLQVPVLNLARASSRVSHVPRNRNPPKQSHCYQCQTRASFRSACGFLKPHPYTHTFAFGSDKEARNKNENWTRYRTQTCGITEWLTVDIVFQLLTFYLFAKTKADGFGAYRPLQCFCDSSWFLLYLTALSHVHRTWADGFGANRPSVTFFVTARYFCLSWSRCSGLQDWNSRVWGIPTLCDTLVAS